MKMNLPNKLTLMRVFLLPLIIIVAVIEGIEYEGNFLKKELFLGVNIANIIVLVIFIIASFTDYLDGHIARKQHIVTDFGKFLDPLADKLLVSITMIYLIQIHRFDFFGMSFAFVVGLIIAREFAVTGLRLLAASKEGAVIAAKMLGKLKTVSQMIMIMVLLLNSFNIQIIGFILVMIALVLTIVSGVDYFIKSKNIFKEEN